MNFQVIIDRLSEALSFFDFSYFISGSASMTIVLTFMWYNGFWPIVLFSSWVQVPLLLISVYISGILSMSLGRWTRQKMIKIKLKLKMKLKWFRKWCIIKDFDSIFNDSLAMAEKVYNLKVDKLKENSKLSYTIMWGELRENENSSKTVEFLNKFWVTQALCEGLMTSCLLAIVTAWFTFANDTRIQLMNSAVVTILSLISFIILSHHARLNAENQIKEVVFTYAKSMSNNNSTENEGTPKGNSK